MTFTKLIQHPYIRSSFIFTVSSFVASVFGYFFNLLIARYLNVSEYGEYMAALSYFFIFIVPFGAFGVYIMKVLGNVPKDKRDAAAYILEKKFQTMILYSAKYIAVLAVVFVFVLYKVSNLRFSSILFLLGFVMVTLFFNFFLSILEGLKEFMSAGFLQIFAMIVKLILGGVIVVLFTHLELLYASIVFSSVAGVILAHYLVSKRSLHKRVHEPMFEYTFRMRKIFHYLSRKSVYIPLLTTLGIVGISSIDIIFVKKFFSAQDAGYYSALSLLAKIILYFTAPLSTVMYSYFTADESKQNAHSLFFFSQLGFIAMGMIAALFYYFFPSLIVNIIFGEKYSVITSTVWIAGIYGMLYALVNLSSFYWMARESHIAYVPLLGIIFQVIALSLFHQNYLSILVVNSVVLAMIWLTYSVFYLLMLSKQYAYFQK